MTTDHDESGLIRSWLDDTYEGERDARPFLDRMLDDVLHTPQRRRHLWRLPSRPRSNGRLRADQATDYEATPVPASDGQAPGVTGRTTSMLSPVKAVAAGIVVFAVGAVVYIAEPLAEPGDAGPGAEAGFAPAVEVTGRFRTGSGRTLVEEGDPQIAPGVRYVFTNEGTVVASDPRLEGTLTFLTEELEFEANGLEDAEKLSAACVADLECDVERLTILSAAHSIENENGAWRQRAFPKAFFAGAGDSSFHDTDWVVEIYDGEGDYADLVAVLTFGSELDDGLRPDDDVVSNQEAFYGFILDARQVPGSPANASSR